MSLSLTPGTLSPAFAPSTLMYTLVLPWYQSSVQIQASPAAADTKLFLNGMPLAAGNASTLMVLGNAMRVADVMAMASDGTILHYTVLVTAPTVYVKASNTESRDHFGSSVSLSGDTLAVGAMFESSNATGVNGTQVDNSAMASGAVYVFQRTGTTWAQQAYLKASNTEASDNFGASVSLSGDSLAVGAPSESSNATGINGNQTDNSAAKSGAVYVFQRTGTTWAQQAYLKASNTEAADQFGSSVSLWDDTLAIAAPFEASNAIGINGNQTDNSAAKSGAVYVFQRAGTTWAQQAYVKASNTEAGDQFGSGISLSGDALAVGAMFESSIATGINGNQADNSRPQSGAAYVFQRTGTTWAQQAYLKASNTGLGDQFGFSVSLSGDTLAVGANYASAQTGAAYVFQRTGTTWAQQAYLKASNSDGSAQFGFSVSLAGDILAVGTPSDSSNATGINGNRTGQALGSGAVYVFQRTGAAWVQQAYVKASNTGSPDLFSNSLSVSGNTLAIAARQESSNATGINGNQADNSAFVSGAVYIFQ